MQTLLEDLYIKDLSLRMTREALVLNNVKDIDIIVSYT